MLMLLEAADRAYGRHLSHNDIARIVGGSRSVVVAAVTRGLPERRADEWAVRLGLHPCEVWGDAWWAPCA
jgi:hypothetical protein